jgi:hypothetical protein
VTTRPSKGDIVLHTALLFYASGRPSFLCISCSFPASNHGRLTFSSRFCVTPSTQGHGGGVWQLNTPSPLLAWHCTAITVYRVRKRPLLPAHFLLNSCLQLQHIFVPLLRHTLDSRAGGRGESPSNPISSSKMEFFCDPRLPCAQASPPSY